MGKPTRRRRSSRHQPNPAATRNIRTSSDKELDWVERFYGWTRSKPLLAVIIVVFTLTGAIAAGWKGIVEAWRMIYPEITLVVLPQQPTITMLANETITIKFDVLLNSTEVLAASDIQLTPRVSRIVKTSHGVEFRETGNQECYVDHENLGSFSIDSRTGKATQALKITCLQTGDYRLGILTRSKLLNREAMADMRLEVVPYYMACDRSQSPSKKEPLFTLKPDGQANTFLESDRELKSLKLFIPDALTGQNPLRATIWLTRAFEGQAAGSGYGVFAYRFGTSTEQISEDPCSVWPDISGPTDPSFEQIAFVGPETDAAIVPVANGVYAIKMDRYGRLQISDVKSEVCISVPIRLIDSQDPTGVTTTKAEWILLGRQIRVQGDLHYSTDGRTIDNTIWVGKHEARYYKALDEDFDSTMPLVIPVESEDLNGAKFFLMISYSGDLDAIECKRIR